MRPSRRLLAAARAAAGRGWPVFPLQPYGKRPAIRGWPQQATTDPDQLAAWWEQAPYNIGIACGPAGLLVVDLDQRGPIRAAGAVDAMTAVARRTACTFTVGTPRGEHRYFAVPAVAATTPVTGSEEYRRLVRVSGRTTAGMLEPRVDTRAAGGYVAAAGSVRWVDGSRRYYRTVGAVGVAPAPRWLLEALLPSPPIQPRCGPVAEPAAYATAVVRREAVAVRTAGPGTRNSRLFGAAVRLGQLAAAGLLTEEDATDALLQAAAGHVGVEEFTAAEAIRAVGNGLAYGRRRPRRTAGTVR